MPPIALQHVSPLNYAVMQSKITFDDLPGAVSQLGDKLDIIQNMLAQRIEPQPAPTQDQFLTAEEAAAFLRLSVPTVYSKVSRGELTVMKQGNRLYFSKSELIDYLKAGKRKSNMEVLAEANDYISKGKKGDKL